MWFYSFYYYISNGIVLGSILYIHSLFSMLVEYLFCFLLPVGPYLFIVFNKFFFFSETTKVRDCSRLRLHQSCFIILSCLLIRKKPYSKHLPLPYIHKFIHKYLSVEFSYHFGIMRFRQLKIISLKISNSLQVDIYSTSFNRVINRTVSSISGVL